MNGDARHLDLCCRSVFAIDRNFLHSIESASVFGAVNDSANDSILAVKMILLRVRDEKLSLVGVWSGVGTGDDASSIELERRADLVSESLAPDRLSTFARTRRIASLNHERLDVAVPLYIVVRSSSAVSQKVLSCSGRRLAEHLDLSKTSNVSQCSQICRAVAEYAP